LLWGVKCDPAGDSAWVSNLVESCSLDFKILWLCSFADTWATTHLAVAVAVCTHVGFSGLFSALQVKWSDLISVFVFCAIAGTWGTTP
jgi:hypothetical protein